MQHTQCTGVRGQSFVRMLKRRMSAVGCPPAGVSSAAAPGGAEPLAREAKWFTESRCLNREVRVVLEGVDKYNNLFGSVFYPEEDKPANLAEAIMAVSGGMLRGQGSSSCWEGRLSTDRG